jgi:GAF domain-containing protein
MLQDVFVRTSELEQFESVEEAMMFLLDLALEKIPCESGAVVRATRGGLFFIAAKGPKAREVLTSKVRLPPGKGLTGACLVMGQAMVIHDVNADTRFVRSVDGQLDRQTKSLMCAPMQVDGRTLGCLRITNRKGGTDFQEREFGLLEYLATQGAQFLARAR